MKNKSWINILSVIIAIAVFAYLFHDVYKSNYIAYATETADESIEQETLDIKGFVVRDEQYISGETDGTVVPLVADGNRVARDDSVARICKSAEDAANYSLLLNAKKDLERYETLSEQTELNALDMEKLNNDIDGCYTKLMETASNGDYSKLNDTITEIEDRFASKQIVSTGSIDLTEKFAALEQSISTLEAKNIKTTDVLAPLSGYYISNIDGYENMISYSDVANVTVSEVEQIMKAEPQNTANKMGKIVGSYKWYIVAVADSKYSQIFSEGMSMKINLPYYGYKDVRVKLEKMSDEKDGKVALVFSCNMMNEVYANMRLENIELVINEYKGYKINSNSIRDVENSEGQRVKVVYILRGTIINARKIEIVYDAGDYVLVKETSEAGDGFYPIKRYDEVIVKGRNLSDGKSIS